jgi:hypothetical protein
MPATRQGAQNDASIQKTVVVSKYRYWPRFYPGCSQGPLVPLFVFRFVMIVDLIV